MRRKLVPTPGDICGSAIFQHLPSGHYMAGTWVFRSCAPFEVILRLTTGRRSFVEWTFSRNLLHEALEEPGQVHGIGDIRIFSSTADTPYGYTLTIELNSPYGRAILNGSAVVAADFVDATIDMLPICPNIDGLCYDTDCQEHDLMEWWIEHEISG